VNAKNISILDEGNETVVQEPDLRETGNALEKQQGMRAFALTALLLLACFYTLYLAEGFFAPLVLAIVLNFFLSPFVRVLGKLWIPAPAAAGIVMLVCACVMGFLIYEFSGPVSEWVQRAPRIMGDIAIEFQKLKKPVEKVTQATEQVSKMAQVGTPEQGKKPAEVELKHPGIIDGWFSKTRDAVLELVVFAVGHLEILVDGHIEVLDARAVEHIAVCVSKETVSGLLPSSRIHPRAIDSRLRTGYEEALTGHVVRPRRKGTAGNGVGAGVVVAVPHVVGPAGLERSEDREFPAPDQRIHDAR